MPRRGKERDTREAFRPEAGNPCLAPDYSDEDEFYPPAPRGGLSYVQEDYHTSPDQSGYAYDYYDDAGPMISGEEEEEEEESYQADRAQRDL